MSEFRNSVFEAVRDRESICINPGLAETICLASGSVRSLAFRWVRGKVEEIDCEGLTLLCDTGAVLSNQIAKLVVATNQLGQVAILIVIPWHVDKVPSLIAVWNPLTNEVVKQIAVSCSIDDPDNRRTSIEGIEVDRSPPE